MGLKTYHTIYSSPPTHLCLGSFHLHQIRDVALGAGIVVLLLRLGLVQHALQLAHRLLQGGLVLLQQLQLLAMRLAVDAAQRGDSAERIRVGQLALELVVLGLHELQIDVRLHQLSLQLADACLVDNVGSTGVAWRLRRLQVALARRGWSLAARVEQVLVAVRGGARGGLRQLGRGLGGAAAKRCQLSARILRQVLVLVDHILHLAQQIGQLAATVLGLLFELLNVILLLLNKVEDLDRGLNAVRGQRRRSYVARIESWSRG